MRVCHVGNMANDGFACVESLRDAGVDAELIVDESEFGMNQPQWETTQISGDPYKLNPDMMPPAPEWVKRWRSNGRNFLYRVVDLNRVIQGYDLLHLHFPTMLYLQFTKIPYLIYEAGFIRQVYGPLKDSNRIKLGIRSYQRAECVTYTNTDTAAMVGDIKPKMMRFVPFAINTERYRPPEKRACNNELEFLHPARMVFDVKGNDRMLRAYRKYIESGGRAHLTLIDWGYSEDVEEAKQIIEPVKKHVSWIPPMNKPTLIKAYQRCDAVLDQFTLGASGTTGFEAMSCGAPLMIYFSPSAAEHFGEPPPCVNVSTESEILEGFKTLEDESLKRRLSVEGRVFAERYLGYPVVARKLKALYEEVE